MSAPWNEPVPGEVNVKDNDGQVPLAVAVTLFRQIDAVRLLHKHGKICDVKCFRYGTKQ